MGRRRRRLQFRSCWDRDPRGKTQEGSYELGNYLDKSTFASSCLGRRFRIISLKPHSRAVKVPYGLGPWHSKLLLNGFLDNENGDLFTFFLLPHSFTLFRIQREWNETEHKVGKVNKPYSIVKLGF